MPAHALSICIVSHNAYGAITGGATGFIGGVERQTSLLARWLASQGHRVCLITWQEGGPQEETITGVRIIKVCRPTDGLPGVRFFHPKWTSLVQALRRADADAYYHNCGECFTGQVAMWCRKNGRAFVFSAASDEDCALHHAGLKSWRERVLFEYGLRHADRRVVQTRRQADMLQENFGLDSVQLPMACPEPPGLGYVSRIHPPSKRVLWVGRLWFEKRPQLFLDLAETCPHLQFDLVGPGFDPAQYGHTFSDDIVRRARDIVNVTVHGALPRDEIFKMYDQSCCLCCTSEYEGFPNTFLEAWSRGLPIVSTFDPDSLIVQRELGFHGTSLSELKTGLLCLFHDGPRYGVISANTRRYFTENHTVESSLPKLEKVLIESAALCKHRSSS